VDCISCQTEFDSFEGPCPKCGWDPDDKLDHMAGYRPGELVKDRYEIHESLGVGRFGTVLSALDQELGIEVAFKVIHPSLLPTRQMQDKFIAGIRSLMRVKHEYMASVFDVGRDEDDRCFVSRQLLGGVPLARLMENRRIRGYAFPLDEVLPIVEKIAQLLGGAGALVHGALSPEKVWILPDHLKITDTGITLHLPQGAVWHCLRSRGKSQGYAAPEIGRGRPINARTDVFFIGAIIGEMMTQVAFDGRAELFRQSDSNLPPAISSILEKALSPNPDDRYNAPIDLLRTLQDACDQGAGDGLFSFDGARADYSFLGDEIDEIRLPLSPKFGDSSDTGVVFDDTAQVLMEDVIRAHAEAPEPEQDLIAPAQRPVHESEDAARSVPPHRPTDLAGLARVQQVGKTSIPIPHAGKPKPVPPPILKKQAEEVDTQRKMVPKPTLSPTTGHKRPLIEPKRPIPLRRDTRPPSYVSPPIATKADDPTDKDDEATAPSLRGGRKKKLSSEKGRTRDKTQEIDISDIAEIHDRGHRQESTQEIDIGMIEASEAEVSGKAAYKLEKQAADAERDSANELIRRAPRLEGVDPRLVRAAHKLESDRRGAHSRQAAQILRERAEHLEDIDPRLLRAAARLEEARVRGTSRDVDEDSDTEEAEPVEKKPEPLEDDDWRERLSKTSNDAVISFLAPATGPRTADVRGFPKIQNRDARVKPVRQTPEPPLTPPPSRRR
jgi:hypothetical protein